MPPRATPPASDPRPADASADAWQVACDGTALPNPGPLGIGAVLVSPAGERHTLSALLDVRGSGNDAEAWALVHALEHALALGARAVCVRSDSRVVVDHMTGRRRVRVARLLGVLARADALCAQLDAVAYVWVPRHRNAEADELARAAFGRTPKPIRRSR